MNVFKSVIIGGIITFTAASCHLFSGQKNAEKSEGNLYLIETSFGNMKLKLYDETPLHKANFDSLVQAKYYDGMLFHRIIEGFMLQGGDPDSKTATPGQQLGVGGPGYTLPAEIIDTIFHKKGALAAARQGDQINPQRRSSGSQFYIVQGKKMVADELAQMEMYMNNAARQQIGYHYFNLPENAVIKEKILFFQNTRNADSLNFYGAKIDALINDSLSRGGFKFSEKAKSIYQTIGGTPQLDGQYTVFGEIVEGLDIIDSIAKVETSGGDRPVQDIRMTIKKL